MASPLPPFIALTDSAILLHFCDAQAQANEPAPAPGLFTSTTSKDNFLIMLAYKLNTNQITSHDLDDLIAHLYTLQQDTETVFDSQPAGEFNTQPPYISAVVLSGPTLSDATASGGNASTLEKFRNQEFVEDTPALLLTIQIVCLILFFVSMMVGALIEQQQQAIAVMRSRGASREQILGSLIVQGVGLCVLAGLVGPILALGLVMLTAPFFLTPTTRDALNALALNPWVTANGLAVYTLAAVAATLATLIFALVLAMRATILTHRREQTRATSRPLWQRLHLDLVVAVLALLSYGLAVYVEGTSQSLSAQAQSLVSVPLAGTAIVSTLAQHTLPANSQNVVQSVLGHPLPVLTTIAPTAGGTLLAALLTMWLIIRYTTRINMLTLRRETARVTSRPFWQRYYLDVLAAIIALSGYGVSLYLASVAHEVDATTQNLILAPLTLVAPLFLLLGFLLLFLRFFPWLLQRGGRVASRGCGATSMLALVQMARAPRQIMRMTLLLSLAVAFALFAQVLSASQTQRISTISTYETGADFSGALPLALGTQAAASISAHYRAIPGVLAASPEFTGGGTTTGTGGATLNVVFHALDTQSFAQTMIWGLQDSSQPLSALLPLLAHAETVTDPNGASHVLLPTIIDQALAQQVELKVGSTFVVSVNTVQQSALSYKVAAIVAHIPTVNASTTASTSGSPGGMLVDGTIFIRAYQSGWTAAQQAQQRQPGQSVEIMPAPTVPFNHLWLRTTDDARALATIRAALASSPLALSNLYDRREIITELQNDPFILNILIILSIGGLAAFLLALLGDLLSSWVSVRARLSNFVVLRALGATSRQIAGMLLWEQSIVYLGALVLGLAFGAVLSFVAVPVLVFTDLPAHGPMSTLSGTDFAFLQHALPVQLVIPLSLELIVLALALVCLIALGTMIRVALRPSISGELRLNED